MVGLAEIVLDHFLTLMFDQDHIDRDYASREMEVIPDVIAGLSADEQSALSVAARNYLARLRSGPDEYGYAPRTTLSGDAIAFLEAIETGELFDQWGRGQ